MITLTDKHGEAMTMTPRESLVGWKHYGEDYDECMIGLLIAIDGDMLTIETAPSGDRITLPADEVWAEGTL